MKIDQSRKKRNHVKETLRSIPKTSMRVTFEMDEKEFELNFQRLLLMNIDARTLPDADIERILQDTFIYRMTLVKALEMLTIRVESLEDMLRHWRAVERTRGYEEIIKHYEETTGRGISATKMAGIKSNQVDDWLYAQTEFFKALHKRQKRIRSLKSQHRVVEGAIKSMDSWQFALSGIAKRRAESRDKSRYA